MYRPDFRDRINHIVAAKNRVLHNLDPAGGESQLNAADIFTRAKPKMAVYSHIIPPEATEAQLRAATPYSARRCIAKVRICSSTGLPCGPITVVWSDWYMLNLGIAM